MSHHYESIQRTSLFSECFNVPAPVFPLGRDVWQRKQGFFVRQCEQKVMVLEGEGTAPSGLTDPTPPSRELTTGQFGLVPRWVKSASDAKLRSTKLFNARSETVTTSNNFRDPWLNGQRCIVPMMAFLENDWRSGKAVPTRVARVDGKPMGVAGLWETWIGTDGETIVSYTLLTVNANSHALINRYQQPGNEKRMLVILNEGAVDAWLSTRPEKAREFMRPYPANWLTANPIEKSH